MAAQNNTGNLIYHINGEALKGIYNNTVNDVNNLKYYINGEPLNFVFPQVITKSLGQFFLMF